MTTRTASSTAAVTPGRKHLHRRVGKGAAPYASVNTMTCDRAVPTNRNGGQRRTTPVRTSNRVIRRLCPPYGGYERHHTDGMTFSAGNQVPSSVGGQGTAMNRSNAM